MSKISNEQLAHDMAMAFMQADINEMSSTNRLELQKICEENLQAGELKANSPFVNYHYLYELFLKHLELFGEKS